MKNRTRALLASATAAILAPLALVTTSAPAHAATGSVEVYDINLGGAHLGGNSFDVNNLTGWQANSALGKLKAKTVDVVTAQEMCGDDADRMRVMGFKVAFRQMTSAADNDDVVNGVSDSCFNDEQGTAVISRHQVWDEVSPYDVYLQQPLTDAGYMAGKPQNWGKQFWMTCLTLKKSGFRIDDATAAKDYLTVCSTHLWSGDPDDPIGIDDERDKNLRAQQSQLIANKMNDIIGNHKIVLGGDFNSLPKHPSIDNIHRVVRAGGSHTNSATINTSAKFWEVDQSKIGQAWDCTVTVSIADNQLCRAGRQTLKEDGTINGSGDPDNRKYDYLFGSHNGLNPHEAGLSATRLGTSIYEQASRRTVPHAYALQGSFEWTNIA